MKTTILLVGLMLIAGADIRAQTGVGRYDPNNRLPDWVRETDKKRADFERLNTRMVRGPLGMRKNPPPGVISRDLGDLQVSAETVREMLRPPKEYWERYAEFLAGPGTGLFRIFPRTNCDQGLTLSPAEAGKCRNFIPIKGGGSFYSFRYQSNLPVATDGWDIRLEGGLISGGNETVQVLMTELTGGELDKVKKGARAFDMLGALVPAKSSAEITSTRASLENGLEVKGGRVVGAVKAEPGSLFAIRIIALRRDGGDERLDRIGRGIDATIAIKIVGEESDGSFVILWKAFDVSARRATLTK